MKNPKILVLGETGQLARSLKYCGLNATFAGRSEFDLARYQRIHSFLDQVKPDCIINTSAYTDVNRAGDADQKELCRALNILAPAAAARWCADHQAEFIHFSTDYVYQDTGKTGEAYSEISLTGPLNFYAETKLQGEEVVLSENPKAWIFRVSWLYSPWGVNFVKKILDLAKTRSELSIVDDQVGPPTSTLFLAREIIAILPEIIPAEIAQTSGEADSELNRSTHKGAERASQNLKRVFNLSGQIYQSWYEFSLDILDLAFKKGMLTSKPIIGAVSSEAFPSPVKRPFNSRLNCQKYQDFFGRSLTRDLKDDLSEVLELIKD